MCTDPFLYPYAYRGDRGYAGYNVQPHYYVQPYAPGYETYVVPYGYSEPAPYAPSWRLEGSIRIYPEPHW